MFKTCGLLACLSGLSLASAPRAEEPSESRAVLDQGIKALGGADKLTKVPGTTFKSQGYLLLGQLRVESTATWSVQYPDKYRYDGKPKFGENDGIIALREMLAVGNGDKGWTKSNNEETSDLSEDVLVMLRQDTRAVHLAQRLVPLTEKDYTLSVLGELKIDGHPAVGIKVAQKKQPDLDLYFDKETHLPVKVLFRCTEKKDAETVAHAFVFSDYKETDGVKHFTKIKMYREDKQILEMNLSEVNRVEKVEANLFEKP